MNCEENNLQNMDILAANCESFSRPKSAFGAPEKCKAGHIPIRRPWG
jgi:hypothetical protein